MKSISIILNIVFLVSITFLLIYLVTSDFLKKDCDINPPMTSYCETYNIENLEGCVREGYTGTGFLGMTDWNTEYWVCEEYGRIAKSCSEWSKSESNLTKDWEGCK